MIAEANCKIKFWIKMTLVKKGLRKYKDCMVTLNIKKNIDNCFTFSENLTSTDHVGKN